MTNRVMKHTLSQTIRPELSDLQFRQTLHEKSISLGRKQASAPESAKEFSKQSRKKNAKDTPSKHDL